MSTPNAVVKKNIVTPEFRASYAYIFTPGQANDQGKRKYAITMLFPKGADLTMLKNAAREAVIERWGADKTKWPALRTPFRDQGEKKDKAGYEPGCFFITATADNKPGVVDQSLQDIIEPSQFYSGCWARASVRAFTYDNKGNRGVSFGLQNLQKIRDGEPLGGRAKASEEFEPVDVPADASASQRPEDVFAGNKGGDFLS